MTDDALAAGTGRGRSDAAFGVIAGLLAWGLLLANTAAWRGQHALETQSFVVVYLLGVAFLADAAVCRRWRRSAPVDI